MNKFVTVLIIILIAFFVLWIKKLYSCLNFKFDIDKLDLSTLKLSDISKSNITVRLKTKICIDNCNNVGFNFKDLRVYLYYKNSLIAKTSEIEQNVKTVYINKRSNACFYEYVDLIVNENSIKLAALIKLGQHENIDYIFKIRFFGIPITYRGTYTY